MDDPATDSSDVLQRTEQAQAQSKALREQVARTAEAVAETGQGGPRAAEAREHADPAEDFAAKERAEAERLRRAEPG